MPNTQISNNPEKINDITPKSKRKGSIKKVLIMLIAVALGFLTVSFFASGKGKEIITVITGLIRKETIEAPITTVKKPIETTKTYNNEQYSFSFIHQRGLEIEQVGPFSDAPVLYKIKFKGLKQSGDLNEDSDLIDGYIFKVFVHEQIQTPVETLAERKKEKYLRDCEKTAIANETTQTSVGGVTAYTFSVNNCPQYYEDTFLAKYDFIFEIVQVYRGDIGYRQQYKTQMEEILKSFVFTKDESVPEPTTQTYIDKSYGFSFIHLKLDPNCCDLTGPSGKSVEKLVVLRDENENRIGVFVDTNLNAMSFERYIIEQKQLLISEYRIIVEENPTDISEEIIRIGEVGGIKLKGYAWYGDVVYVPSSNGNVFVILVKSKSSDKNFSEIFEEILDSFKFFPVEK